MSDTAVAESQDMTDMTENDNTPIQDSEHYDKVIEDIQNIDTEWVVLFDLGEEVMGFDTKGEMKEWFDLAVKDLERFDCITIGTPIKRPKNVDCYGDLEAEDWCWRR